MEFLYSILGGGFVGAGVVAILFKYLLKTSLQRSIDKYKHELALDKQSLQHQFERETQKIQSEIELDYKVKSQNMDRFVIKKIEAMEEAYQLFVGLMTTFFNIRSWDVYLENAVSKEDKINIMKNGVSDYHKHIGESYKKWMLLQNRLLELYVYMPEEIEETLSMAGSVHQNVIEKYSKKIDVISAELERNDDFEFSFQEFRLNLLKELGDGLRPAKFLMKHYIRVEFGIEKKQSEYEQRGNSDD